MNRSVSSSFVWNRIGMGNGRATSIHERAENACESFVVSGGPGFLWTNRWRVPGIFPASVVSHGSSITATSIPAAGKLIGNARTEDG
jgi:hypothetical protein